MTHVTIIVWLSNFGQCLHFGVWANLRYRIMVWTLAVQFLEFAEQSALMIIVEWVFLVHWAMLNSWIWGFLALYALPLRTLSMGQVSSRTLNQFWWRCLKPTIMKRYGMLYKEGKSHCLLIAPDSSQDYQPYHGTWCTSISWSALFTVSPWNGCNH